MLRIVISELKAIAQLLNAVEDQKAWNLVFSSYGEFNKLLKEEADKRKIILDPSIVDIEGYTKKRIYTLTHGQINSQNPISDQILDHVLANLFNKNFIFNDWDKKKDKYTFEKLLKNHIEGDIKNFFNTKEWKELKLEESFVAPEYISDNQLEQINDIQDLANELEYRELKENLISYIKKEGSEKEQLLLKLLFLHGLDKKIIFSELDLDLEDKNSYRIFNKLFTSLISLMISFARESENPILVKAIKRVVENLKLKLPNLDSPEEKNKKIDEEKEEERKTKKLLDEKIKLSPKEKKYFISTFQDFVEKKDKEALKVLDFIIEEKIKNHKTTLDYFDLNMSTAAIQKAYHNLNKYFEEFLSVEDNAPFEYFKSYLTIPAVPPMFHIPKEFITLVKKISKHGEYELLQLIIKEKVLKNKTKIDYTALKMDSKEILEAYKALNHYLNEYGKDIDPKVKEEMSSYLIAPSFPEKEKGKELEPERLVAYIKEIRKRLK